MNLSSVFLFLVLAVSRCQSDEDVFHNDEHFDAAEYGVYPVQKYRSTDLVSPHLNVLQSSSECAFDLYTFFTPRGPLTSEPNAVILDQGGHLVWTSSWEGQQIYNLMVQEYNGESYLTFWAGNDAVGGHGAGFYFMLDKHYKVFKKIGAAGGLDADLHDFRLTENGTALMTVYQVINKDLAELGKPIMGEIWDCLIQEVDIETGELIFQWRASDHYKVSDTFRPIDDDGVIGRAFDFFHMNSIAKDYKGNYLTSSRYMHSLTYINGSSGEVIWIIGGKRNMFEDLSDGQATNFAYQHDGRWSDDHTTVTMFDNGVDDPHPDIADTRGLRLELDEERMTVKLVAVYKNPHNIHGISQGSFQTLPNGNAFMGYGNTAAFTEYSHNGTVLCDAHFGAESRFGAGEVQSYRAYKYGWHGWPTTSPNVAILQNEDGGWSFYVSWNGATEVNEWVLQGADEVDGAGWVDLNRILKVGFETEFDINAAYPRYMRVLALNSNFKILGVGGLLDLTLEKVIDPVINSTADPGTDINPTQTWSLPPLRIEEGDTWWLKIMLGFCSLGGLCVGLREARVVWRRRRLRRSSIAFQRLDDIRLD
ncbi:uncharacterized protein LY89DRAFT_782413 [Mollisia scopiformis]|uniref:ASST-domain-containing protein n=1 Tax=Mollisia scopiformis TaxID=149040 RepID=A0A194XAP4_MOLSC|nr:uncharacterized protein LY89DRAFT_782413 [Mollisia scopiformis]KUJ17246.1 hypothetical protein LY89DRAFT_782413 [Mollisia scopiformis]